jgi:thioredoxin
MKNREADKMEIEIEVTDADFNEKVIEASNNQPIAVDFWAEWCGPCTRLGPILEKLAKEYGGKFVLAKLDVQGNQAMAQKYGIMSIHCVKLFKNGKVVDEFIGALPESEFWKRVFEKEFKYILRELKGCKDVLSVGCGPAIIERGLQENGFNVTGLDISKEALEGAPDSIRTVVGSAESMDFADSSFDAAIYVASLQFIDDYEKAIRETARVLKPEGMLLVMLLNPESEFFKEKMKDSGSYVSQIKHPQLASMEEAILGYFDPVKSGYHLGIRGKEVFESRDLKSASLYIVIGRKK